MNSDNDTYTLLTNNDESSEDNCKSKPLGDIAEHIELITSRTKDEIRNFIIDELIYRLKDMYPNISNETISIIADEVMVTIDNIISEISNNVKSIDELIKIIKNERTYNALATTTLMIIKSKETNSVEVNEVDVAQIMKVIIKNTLKLYGQKT